MCQNEKTVSNLAELTNEIEHALDGTPKTIYINEDIEITFSVKIPQFADITLKPSTKDVKICRTNSVNNPETGLFDVDMGDLTIAGDKGLTLTIEGNKDESNNQPLIHCHNGGSFNLQKLAFLQNNITDNGGAVYVGRNSRFTMEGGLIMGNKARCNGGAIYANYDGSVYIKGGLIKKNIAGANGGGIYFCGTQLGICNLDISSGNITENTAGNAGGGVYVNYDGTASSRNINDSSEKMCIIRSKSIVRFNTAIEESAFNDIYPIFGWKEEESQ